VGEFTHGLRLLLDEPRGFGLGTSPSVGARFGFQQTFVSDNSYLQVGNELGVVMMVLFIALMVTLLRRLRAAYRSPPFDPLAAAFWAAGIGLSVVAMIHQVWLSIPVSWLFFLGCGIALSQRPHDAELTATSAASRR
jgi:O-antigen ligase